MLNNTFLWECHHICNGADCKECSISIRHTGALQHTSPAGWIFAALCTQLCSILPLQPSDCVTVLRGHLRQASAGSLQAAEVGHPAHLHPFINIHTYMHRFHHPLPAYRLLVISHLKIASLISIIELSCSFFILKTFDRWFIQLDDW